MRIRWVGGRGGTEVGGMGCERYGEEEEEDYVGRSRRGSRGR